MALDDFKNQSSGADQYKNYNLGELDEAVTDAAQPVIDLMPENFQLDFIEVSPRMTRTAAKIFRRVDGEDEYYFIRISEDIARDLEPYGRVEVQYSVIRMYVLQVRVRQLKGRDAEVDMDNVDIIASWIAGFYGIALPIYLAPEKLFNTAVTEMTGVGRHHALVDEPEGDSEV